jgi:beta-lactamase superfamily II metal-dependent hydrolase
MGQATRISARIRALRTIAALPGVFALVLFVFLPGSLSAAIAFDELKELAPFLEVPLPLSLPAAPAFPARPLRIYFLDVGQGDSAFIELPNGRNVLIDGGPSRSKTGGLAKFLSDHRVTRIDNVVMTHPHADHYTGLKYVFSGIPVTNFYDTRLDNTGTAADEALRAQVKALGVNTVYPAPGDMLDWDPAEVRVKTLNSCPKPQKSGDGEVINNCSIVLKLTYQHTSMLLTGDMQDDVERTLVDRYGSELKADLLKVGHHGSRYSSGDIFLSAVRPTHTVISVGEHNTYGHPTADCISRIRTTGATIHRTDTDGAMTYTVNADSAVFSSLSELFALRY